MDTPIEEQVKTKRKRKTILYSLIAVLILVLTIWLVRYAFATTLTKKDIVTAVVETGNIENTISATGEILPEFEEIITSPIKASIKNVMMDAGKNVNAGESILELDKSATQTDFEKLKFQVEEKHNDVTKLRLELDKSFYDLKSNNDIKQLKINSLEADVENAKRLYKAGGGTKEDIEKAELDLKVAQLEKQQLENEIKSKQQTMQVEMKQSEIDAAIEENDLSELKRKLDQANIVTSRAGVITWINKNIGASVNEGDQLARVADLSSFKVAGSISDSYLDQLHPGMTAIVKINDQQIRGIVTNIYPAVQNGIVSFDVRLDEQNNKLLRPNLKADLFLVTSSKTNVMRIANGPAFRGASTQDVFVLNGNTATKRTVHIGMTNFDYVEVKDNLKPGDVVIISDMSDYKNSKEITIKN